MTFISVSKFSIERNLKLFMRWQLYQFNQNTFQFLEVSNLMKLWQFCPGNGVVEMKLSYSVCLTFLLGLGSCNNSGLTLYFRLCFLKTSFYARLMTEVVGIAIGCHSIGNDVIGHYFQHYIFLFLLFFCQFLRY